MIDHFYDKLTDRDWSYNGNNKEYEKSKSD